MEPGASDAPSDGGSSGGGGGMLQPLEAGRIMAHDYMRMQTMEAIANVGASYTVLRITTVQFAILYPHHAHLTTFVRIIACCRWGVAVI